jgi:hypothetical protein
MKSFDVTSGMTNMRGVFYPTGHMVLMFPTEQHARHACELLRRDGVVEDDLCLAAPADFEHQMATRSTTTRPCSCPRRAPRWRPRAASATSRTRGTMR